MSKHILITGGGGFIGSHVADELLRAGYRVRALDNLSPQVHGPGWEQFAVLIRSAAHWAQQRGKKTVLGGLSCVDPHWLAAMCDRGVSQYIDAVGIHGYPVTFEFRSEGWEPMAGRIRETLDAQGSDAQVWITETGYWRHDERRQLTTFVDALDAPVQRVYWYAAHDLVPKLSTTDGFHAEPPTISPSTRAAPSICWRPSARSTARRRWSSPRPTRSTAACPT